LTLSYYQSTELLQIKSESNGVVCMAAIPGLLPPDETAELSTAFGQSKIQAPVLCASTLLADSHEEEEALIARRSVATTPIANRIQQESLVPVFHTPMTTLLSRRDENDDDSNSLTPIAYHNKRKTNRVVLHAWHSI
jgi:hypothetical protein